MQGTIFNIQRFCVHDGPGIRTTVFFKGCNLRCAWCHNPESQSATPEIMFYKDKCTGCGRCKAEGDKADFVCYNDARETCGKILSSNEIIEEVVRDKSYYDSSMGGVTFSGGECMLQTEFLLELLVLCKQNGIKTAVDTAGNVPYDKFERVIPYTDLVLYDLKAMDSGIHKRYTGVDNALILDNYKRLIERKIPVWVRIPIVTGVNDSDGEITKFKQFFDKFGYPEKIELMPYHGLGVSKSEALSKSQEKFTEPTKERLAKIKQILGIK